MLSRLISPALAILISLACALAFSPATAEAAGPGKIVYSSLSDGKIKLMNADGSNPTALTGDDFSGRDPALSADGQWIAFIALQFPGGGADPVGGIWVMKAEPQSASNVPVRVSPLTQYGYRLSWHPGGRWLAYTDGTTAPFKVAMLSVLDASGAITPGSALNPPVVLTTNPAVYTQDPAFAPDGKFLAFSDGVDIQLLRVFNDIGNPTPQSLTNPSQVLTAIVSNAPQSVWPSWNNDGTKIVCAQVKTDTNFANPKTSIAVLTVRNALGTVTPETAGNPRQIYSALVTGRTELMPSWSPDGAFIIFNGLPPTGAPFVRDTVRINASAPEGAGNPRLQLTQTAEGGGYSAQFPQPGGTLIVPPTVSPVPANIVAWYPGDYAAADIVGAQHASLQNDISYVAGKVGRGIHFDGDADYAPVQDSAALNIVSNITIEAWINPTTITGSTRSIVSKKNNNDAASTFYLNLQADGKLSFSSQRTDGTFFNILSTTTIPTGQFSHVAATMRGSIVTLYRNGAVIGTGTTGFLRPATPGGQMVIGGKRTQLSPNQLTSFFHGVIDELAIYNRALSEEEIAGIFTAGALGKLRDDAARDFTAETNDASQLWSYGSMALGVAPDVATFTLFGEVLEDDPLRTWRDTGTTTPNLAKNTADAASDIFQPQQLSLDPGDGAIVVGSKFSVVRWKAAAAGSYAIGADFSSVRIGSFTASTGYSVWHNDLLLASGGVSGSFFTGAPPSHPFSQVVTAAAGDVVDFVVGADQSTGNDETGLFASMVKMPAPEPVFEDPEDIDVDVTGTPMAGKTWEIKAKQNASGDHEGRITLRVQKSSNPSDPGSWTDVPNSNMTLTGSRTWKILLDDEIPVGNFAFRVVSSVAGLGDRFTGASEIFNIVPAAPVLELIAEVSAASDATGATTHRGDLLTYTFKARNTGALPATGLILDCLVPYGVKTLTKSKGSVARTDRTFKPFIYNYLSWKIATLVPSAEFTTFSYTVSVIEPAVKHDATLNYPGAKVFSYNTLRKADGTFVPAPINANLETTIGNPLLVEAVADTTTPDQGGFVSFTITVTNKASYTAKKVRIDAPTPVFTDPSSGDKSADGMFLPFGGDVMQFLDDSGVPSGAPTDPATKKTAKFNKGFNPQRHDAGPHGTMVASFFAGSMAPGEVQKVRVRMQVQYDYYNHVFFGNPPTFRSDNLTARSVSPAARIVTGTAPPIDFHINLVPDAPKPVISVALSQRGASEYNKAGEPAEEPRRIVTVTAAGLPVPGETPARLSNEIRYRAVVLNTGAVGTDFLRMLLAIPAHTKYKASSLRIDGLKPAKAPEFGELGDTVLMGFDLPHLAANAPFNAGSIHIIDFTVKVDPKAPVGRIIEQSGGFIVSREIYYPFFGLLPALTSLQAEVVKPATMDYQVLGQEVSPGMTQVRHFVLYRNTGGLAASQVGVRYHIPAGLKFQSAEFVDFETVTAAIAKTRSIVKPAIGATSGTVIFNVGTVPKATVVKGVVKPGGGMLKVTLTPDPDNLTRAATTGDPDTRTQDGAYRIDAQIETYDSTTTQPGAPIALLATNALLPAPPPPSFTRLLLPTAYYDPTLAKTFAAMMAPSSMLPTDELTYTVIWGNLSGVTAGVGAIQIPIPGGTEYVVGSATTAISTVGQNDAPTYRAPGEVAEFPNGFVGWVTNSAPHSAKIGTFKVRLKPGTAGKVVASGGRLGLDQSGRRYIADVPTHILDPGQSLEAQQANIYATSVGEGTSASLADGLIGPQFAGAARLISTQSMSMSVAGADFAKVETNGVIAIPLGGGQIVAAGAGNLIGNDGGTLVAAGGGNIVAAGAGNAISINAGAGLITATQLIASAPQLVAAGGLNLVAAGGGNLVAAGGGNLVGNDGASLVGMDGATLIGLDGATLGAFRMGFGGASFLPSGGGAAIALGAQGANLVAAGGLNLVAAGGGNLVAAGGLNLVAAGGLNLVAAGGLNLTPQNSAALVAAGAGNLGAQAGGSLVAAGGGNVVNSSNGIVAAGGLNNR